MTVTMFAVQRRRKCSFFNGAVSASIPLSCTVEANWLDRGMTSRRLLIAIALVLGLSGCGPFGGDDQEAQITAALNRFTAGLKANRLTGAVLADAGDAAAANALIKPLAPISSMGWDGIHRNGDKATATLQWELPVQGHVWKHDTQITVVK